MRADRTPVYICCRNRLTPLVRLIDWLRDAGTERIIVVDNQSTYEPLLTYYAALPSGVELHCMGKNAGPWNSWEWASAHSEEPFVFTDGDVVPTESCPRDLVEVCLAVYREHKGCGKVGPGLRLDNIPQANLEREYFMSRSLGSWESQFWVDRVGDVGFRAPIDTTFALYGAHGKWSSGAENIRLDAPYLAEHYPWYVTTKSKEDEYYSVHATFPGTNHM